MTSITSIDGAAKAVGEAVRNRRQFRSWGIDDVSNRTGIGSKTLTLVEDGKTDVALNDMLRLLHGVGMDLLVPGAQIEVRRALWLETRLGEIRSAINDARKAKEGFSKISLKKVSDASGIEQGQIGRIGRGDIVPRFKTFLALMLALNIPVRFCNMKGTVKNPKTAPAPVPPAEGLQKERKKKAAKPKSADVAESATV